jgi:tripartite-type tricarboxylate transporter receptor subunit TctC
VYFAWHDQGRSTVIIGSANERENHGLWRARAPGIFGLTLAVGFLHAAMAQQPAVNEYPLKPVRFVVVTAPGGGLDVVGRIVADRLSRHWLQPVIVENRPGAGGNIASEYVARGLSDGYTLLETTNNHNINPLIYKRAGYDPRRDFVPVVQLTEAPSVIVVNPRNPVRTLNDLVAAARVAPGKLVYAHGGNGQPTHVAMELFKRVAALDIAPVAYKGGGPATQDVIGGQILLAMSALPGMSQHLQSGALHVLAMTSAKRWPTLPDVPTVAESGFPGYQHMTWIGLMAPAGAPAARVSRINRAVAEVLTAAEVRKRILAIGALPVGASPAAFAAMLKADYQATARLVEEIGLKVN